MQVLFISSGNQPLLIALKEQISHKYPNDEFKHINYYQRNPIPLLSKIPVIRFFYRILLFFSYFKDFQTADAINIHYVDSYTKIIIVIAKLINKRLKIIISIWGSDLHLISKRRISFRYAVFFKSDLITFTNSALLDEFNLRYDFKFKTKTRLLRFGLKQLNLIKELYKPNSKSEIKYKKNINFKYCILAGTNGQPNQQHEKMINELIHLDKDILAQTCFIFPLTYGSNVNKIKDLLKRNELNYIVYDQWLSDNDIAELRIICDITLQLQTNDQLSGAMQEALFAGNHVITGTWLIYNDFLNAGITYDTINDFSELNHKINEILSNSYSYNKDNPDKIWELSSWDTNLDAWYKLYQE